MSLYTDNKAGTSITTGLDDYVITGSVGQYDAIIGASDLVDGGVYAWKVIFADIADGDQFETFTGAYNAGANPVINRTTIKTSSNSNNKVDWPAGTKVLYIVQDSELATDMENMVEGPTAKILTPSERTSIANSASKLGLITVTQPVDLDQMEADIAAFSGGMTYRGTWDASTGVFPGGGVGSNGDYWYCSVTGVVDTITFDAGDSIVALVNNPSISTFSGNWSRHDSLDAVQSVAGLTGTISQPDLREATGFFDITQAADTGSGDDSIIVMVCPGNSLIGGWLAGSYPSSITTNPNVYVWQAASGGTQTAAWQNVNFSGSPHGTAELQYLGHCGGNVMTLWYAAADRVQRKTGKKVFCIVSYMGGAGATLFDPARGNTNNNYPYVGQTADNNMWYWTSTAVNNAMTALRAGTTGAPAAYPSKTFVDIVYTTASAGEANGAVGFPGAPYWTIADGETMFVTSMAAFIVGAETSGGIGGWAKPWYTRWFTCDIPAGTEGGGTPSYEYVFNTFRGNDRLLNETRSLVFAVPSATGKLTASATTLGTTDNVHWNSFTNAAMGCQHGDFITNTPAQRGKFVDRDSPVLQQFVSGIVSGSGAVAFDYDTVNAMGSTAFLGRWRNQSSSTQQFKIENSGEIQTPTFISNYLGFGALFTGVSGIAVSTGIINSAATDGPTAVAFSMTVTNTLSNASALLMRVKNNAGAEFTFNKDAELATPRFATNYSGSGNARNAGGYITGTGIYNSEVANGAFAIAFDFKPTTTYSTTGALLFRVKNFTGTDAFVVDKDAEIQTPTFFSNYLGFGALFNGANGIGITSGRVGSNVADGTNAVAFAFTPQVTYADTSASLFMLVNGANNAFRIGHSGSVTVGVESSTEKSFGFGSVGDIRTQLAAWRYTQSTQRLTAINYTASGDTKYHMTVMGDGVGFAYRDIANPNGLFFTSGAEETLTAGAMNAPGTASRGFKLKSLGNFFDDSATGSKFTSLAGTLSRNVTASADGTLTSQGYPATYLTPAYFETTNATETAVPGATYVPADGESGVVEMNVYAWRTNNGGTYSGKFNVTYVRAGTVACSQGAFSSFVVTAVPYEVVTTGTGSSLAVDYTNFDTGTFTGIGFTPRVKGVASQTWRWRVEYARKVLS